MSMSTPASSSGRSGDEPTSVGWTLTGPKVGVQPEPAAQREQGLLGPDRRARVGPLRAADRAEQDRVGLAARGEVLVADRDPEGIDGGAADEVLRPVDPEPEARPGRVDDAPRGGDDLGPDPVAGDRRDAVARELAGRALGHGIASPRRGATNATDTPLISAPWSLLTATR